MFFTKSGSPEPSPISANRTSLEYDIWNNYSPKNDRLVDATFEAMVGTEYADECEVTYTYDDLGRVTNINRPVDNGKGNLAYEYDIHGWIDNISSNSFKEQLHYNDGDGTPLFSGNISSVSWSNGSTPNRGYKYTYDSLNRLVNAEYGENHFSTGNGNFNESVSYDSNGNIKTLVRNGQIQGNTYGAIDNLEISYNGNQPYAVNEKASPVLYSYSLDVKDSSIDIRYNSNGSLVNDGTRGITNIAYDDNNNPVRIQFDNGNVTKYIYSATGQKLRAIHYTAMDNIHIDTGCDYEDIEDDYLAVDSTDYLCGGMILYTNAKPSKILFDGGYIDVSYVKRNAQRPRRTSGMTDEEYLAILERWRAYIAERTTLGYRFYNKDHLGNIREVIDEDGDVCQKTDYYPFGTPFSSETYAINAAYQPYKYNGKEFDMMHGLNTYDYGARQYHPLLPLWDRVDPLAEKYYSTSPYGYCLGNPVNNIDPDGRIVETLWDAANVTLDIASCTSNLTNGNFLSAAVDAGALLIDVAATAMPFVPGGAGTAVKAFRRANTFKANIKAGKEFERSIINTAKKEGRDISTQITVTPKNGVGNVKGNRSRVDMLEKKKDGTYAAYEIKLSPKSKPSKGQKAIEDHTIMGNQSFEVRSQKKGFNRGDEIKITDYRYIYKPKIRKQSQWQSQLQ